MAITKTKVVLVAVGTSNAAGATTRGTVDLADKAGGVLTLRIVNGATGPTAQCEGRVLISHEAVLPAAAGNGADWKQVWRFGGGLVANADTVRSFTFGPEVRHLEVEFTGNAGQAVTVEALLTHYAV